jgi:hypothetical protein
MAAIVMVHKWWYDRAAPAAGPDGYRVSPGDPYEAGHRLMDGYLRDCAALTRRWDIAAADLQAGRVILAAGPHLRIAAVHAAIDRIAWLEQDEALGGAAPSREARARFIRVLQSLLGVLLARWLPCAAGDLRHVVGARTADRQPLHQRRRLVAWYRRRWRRRHGQPSEWWVAGGR